MSRQGSGNGRCAFAAGRRAAVDGLALEKAGLAVMTAAIWPSMKIIDRGAEYYAAGDVIGFPLWLPLR